MYRLYQACLYSDYVYVDFSGIRILSERASEKENEREIVTGIEREIDHIQSRSEC